MNALDHWRDEENARQYDRFTRAYPMYQLTSADLVQRADLRPDSRVLDLACGTGVTTEAILERLGPEGTVLAVDASAAMLRHARARVSDARVTWVETTAEAIATDVPRGLTHVVCNSAIWQLDLPTVAAAVAELLVPGGRFVCNLGAAGGRSGKPSLHELMRAYAVIDHGFVRGPSPMARRLVNEDDIRRELTTAGLMVEPTEYVEYPYDAPQLYAWMAIPLFTEQFTGLSHERRKDALDKAYAKLDPTEQPPSRWAILTASSRRPPSGDPAAPAGPRP